MSAFWSAVAQLLMKELWVKACLVPVKWRLALSMCVMATSHQNSAEMQCGLAHCFLTPAAAGSVQ